MQPGQSITPNIKLVSLLGQGGMGAVWRAEHLALGTHVAVKVISPSCVGDPETMARFLQEAQAAARIKSPHVASVFDSGVTDEGAPFIVMELLEGETLRARLDRLKLMPLHEVVHVVRQVTLALSRAHGLGIIHRDIKPENLFLLDDEGEPFVKVLDFGIAKQTGEDSPVVTLDRAMLGTPCYMSPQQITSAKSVDHRADLWSLAVVAYEALTGRVPFAGDSVAAIAVALHAGRFTPPSALRPDLPRAVDAWMAQALHKDIAARFGTARELWEALEKAAGRGGGEVAPGAALPPEKRASAETMAAPQAPQPQPSTGRRDRISAGSARHLQVRRGRIMVMRGEITEAGTEAIVSPADPTLSGVSGLVARAILRAAGRELFEMLRRAGTCPIGSAVATPAGSIPPPTRMILHAVGPPYDPQHQISCAGLLRNAHEACLRLAEEAGIRSIAFPAISRSLDPYPYERLAPIAIGAAIDHLERSARSVETVAFVLLTHGSYQAFAAALAARSKI